MSLLHQHNVHPSLFMDYFNRIAVEYAKHLSKLIRQKNAQREQERNIVPHILIVDIDFSQNYLYGQEERYPIGSLDINFGNHICCSCKVSLQ